MVELGQRRLRVLKKGSPAFRHLDHASISSKESKPKLISMLSQPATKIFMRTTEPKAAKWVSEAIGEIEIERIRETHFDGSRTGRNFALDRQTEPLVLPSEISGLDDLRGFLKYGNHVARFSFPFVSLREKSPAFDERKMDDLIVPNSPPLGEPEELQGNLLSPEQAKGSAEHQME